MATKKKKPVKKSGGSSQLQKVKADLVNVIEACKKLELELEKVKKDIDDIPYAP
jgi:hypothetical protein